MIGKVGPRGDRVAGLLYYLFGPGRSEEHTDPHLVAGWRDPGELEPQLRAGGRRDFRRLAGLLQQPHAALGPDGFARPVWHCSVRAAPHDRVLSDAEWAQVACEVMDRTGLAPCRQDDEAVRWVAVRHASDHIHLVAVLARQDGARPRFWNDFYRVGEACRAAEERLGLRRTAPRDRTAPRRATRAESEKARRRGFAEPPRITLRRAVSTAAAGAGSEEEFFARLEHAGVSVRTRHSARDPGQVTGYAVALPGDLARDGGLIWHSGGKLAADLTLPKLRRRWSGRSAADAERLSFADRDAIWEHAARAAGQAARVIRECSASDPGAAADAAWAAADTLHAAASALGSRVIRHAADAYDRAARAPYGRIPSPTPAGSRLRHAARLLSAVGTVSGEQNSAQVRLVIQLLALAEAIAELRQAQRHAAQAAAARRAAQHLRAARRAHATRPPGRPGENQAARLAALGFPAPPATSQDPRLPPVRPATPVIRPTRRARPPRHRGPGP